MSVGPVKCQNCRSLCEVTQIAPLAKEAETAFGVTWRCGNCAEEFTDICPVGPLVPVPGLCLNCGVSLVDDCCTDCGMTVDEAELFFGLWDMPENDPVGYAVNLLNLGRARRALAVLNTHLLSVPEDADAWMAKSEFLRQLGFADARLQMLRGATAAGAPAALLISCGIALFERGQFEEAMQAYRDYLDREPSGEWRAVAMGNLGNAAKSLDRFELAETMYQRAIDLAPSETTFYLNYIRLVRKDVVLALELIEGALEQRPTPEMRSLLLEEKSFIYGEEQKGLEALAAAEAAVLLSSSITARYLKGRALALLGRLDEARQEMNAVLVNDPGNVDAARAIKMLTDGLGKGLFGTN